MKFLGFFLGSLLIFGPNLSAQSCGTPNIKEPEKITFNRKVVLSYFVGVPEFSDETYQTYYRHINYSGGWSVENHARSISAPCNSILSNGKIEVAIEGKAIHSIEDGSIIQSGLARQVDTADPISGELRSTRFVLGSSSPYIGSFQKRLLICPFSVTSKTNTEKVYATPSFGATYCYDSIAAVGSETIFNFYVYLSSLSAESPPTISLSEPDTFEDAIDNAETRNGSVFYDSVGEALSIISQEDNRRVQAASVDVEALFKGCPESRWEIQMVVGKENLLNNTTSEHTERHSFRMNQNSEYTFKHKLVAEERFTRVWIKSLHATEQPSCNRFDEHGNLGSIHWSASLGGNSKGESAGALQIDAESMDNLAYAPSDLALSHRDEDTVVVLDADESIRQIITTTTVADIVTESEASYDIKLYYREASWIPDSETGIYPVSGTPFVTYTISQQIANGAEHLRIATTRGGSSEYREFGCNKDDSSETWTMWEGSGARRTSIIEDLDYASDPHAFVAELSDVTSKTTSVYDNADNLISRVERIYELQTLGSGYSNGYSGSSWSWSGQANTFEHKVLRIERFFRENETEPAYEIFYTYGTEESASDYNRLILQQDSRGPWKKWTYHEDGRIHTEESGYLNSASDDVSGNKQLLTHVYSTVADMDSDGEDETLKTSTLKILDNTIEVFYELEFSGTIISGDHTLKEVWHIQSHTPTAAWDAADNIVSKRWIHVNDDLSLDGGEYASLNPDNTTVINKRVLNNDGTATLTVYRGAAIIENGVPTGVSAGTINTQEVAVSGATISEETEDVESGLVINSVLYSDFDDENRAGVLTFLDGTQEERNYSCCGLKQVTARDGLITDYIYDSLGRIEYTITAMGTNNQQVVRNVMDAEGNVTEIYHGPTSSDLNLISEMDYGFDGTLLKTRERYLDAAPSTNRETEVLFSEDANGRQVSTTVYPNGSTQIETYYEDGRLYQVDGNAVRNVRHLYTVEQDNDLGYAIRTHKTVFLDETGTETNSYEKTYTDALGRIYKVEVPDGNSESAITFYNYNEMNQLEQIEDPDGVRTLYAYNSEGEREVTSLDANDNDIIDYGGIDRITRTQSSYANRTEGSENYIVQRQTSEVWDIDNQNSATTISTVDRSLGSLPGGDIGSITWSTTYGQTTRTKSLIDHTSASVTTTTTLPDTSYQVDVTNAGLLATSARYAGDGSILSQQTYNYNNSDENRLDYVVDLHAGTTDYVYYSDGQIKSVTTPDPDTTQVGEGYDAQTTSYAYTDNPTSISRTTTLPDLSTVTETFYPTGELKEIYGSQTYPVEYIYDLQGRLFTQKTWQDKTADTGAVVTAWEYYPSGLLKQKWYKASIAGDGTISGTAGPSYTYTSGGRLKTRTNARGTVSTYTYDPGTLDLAGITHDDEVTSTVSYPQYDRQGRIKQVSDASGTRELSYEKGQLTDEVYTNGVLDTYSIDRDLDSLSRLDLLTLTKDSTELYQVDYGYDAASRLRTVSYGNHTVTYDYDPTAELRETRTFNNGATDVLRSEHRYDYLNRLKNVQTFDSTSQLLNNYGYRYNDLNQRTRVTLADSSYWEYGYDDLGQLDRAEHKNVSDAQYPGRSFGFTFDDIGNRTQTDSNGHLATYTPNDLNQYSQRDVPRIIDVSGSAVSEASVTVNGNTALRLGDYFYHGLDFSASGDSAQQVDIMATASLPDGGDNNAPRIADIEKSEYLAPNPEIFAYDTDGNLTEDGQWSYTWDADNRLIAMEILAIAYNAGIPRQKLEFNYDSQGRRFSKKTYDWDTASNSYLQTSKFLYLYDGWNLIAELKSFQSSPFTLHHSYTWGLDLSGSKQGAGGVGGLLMVTDSEDLTYYPAFDGNGNIMGYYAADNGKSAAEFEYGPFGELIRATGEKKDDFNFRFSTKYEDTETGMLYYGYRYYNAETGRWLNRDPIEEQGGFNLYGMVNNDLANYNDYLGLRDRRNRRLPPIKFNDDQGEEIFDHWINGNGVRFSRTNGAWGEYMKANTLLKPQLRRELQKDLKNRTCSGPVDITFHAVIQNGYKTGYEMLHGTNATVGDFHIFGQATKKGPFYEYDLIYTWNDVIDPNPIYFMDRVAAGSLHLVYNPVDYKIDISWNVNSLFGAKSNGRSGFFYGDYPFN